MWAGGLDFELACPQGETETGMTYALLINKDRLQGEVIAAALEFDGIPSRVAGSELEAIGVLQGELPAIVVWDWPSRIVPAEIFVAMLRSEGFEGYFVVCARTLDLDGLPYDVLISKPFDLEFLVSTVRRLMFQTCGKADAA